MIGAGITLIERVQWIIYPLAAVMLFAGRGLSVAIFAHRPSGASRVYRREDVG
jgi:hypothetical protein